MGGIPTHKQYIHCKKELHVHVYAPLCDMIFILFVFQSSRLPEVALTMMCICENHQQHSLPEEVFRRELVDSCRTLPYFNDNKEKRQSVPASTR